MKLADWIRKNRDTYEQRKITKAKVCRGCGKKNLDAYRKKHVTPIHLPFCEDCRMAEIDEMLDKNQALAEKNLTQLFKEIDRRKR